MSHDLMHSAEIKELVREAYRHVPASTAAVAYKLYTAEELSRVPPSAINRALGVANHLRFANIKPGDTILDIGCGGGIDTILAAQRTGPTGNVIGLDFLPEMLQRTAKGGAGSRPGKRRNPVGGDGSHSALRCQRGPHHLQRRHQPLSPKGPRDCRMRPGAPTRRATLRVRLHR